MNNTKKFLLTIAYDGTKYSGWQRQERQVTVQETIENALKVVFNKSIAIRGASRTDSGVHAIGQRAVFNVETTIPVESLPLAINNKLPRDIRITKAIECDSDFHPQYDAKKKTYIYKIYIGKIMNPLLNNYAWHVKPLLDIEKMNIAAKVLIGEHNFLSFCAVGGSAKTFERTIYDIDVKKIADNTLEISVTGNGFLYNMVRIISGTLVYMGYGKLDYLNMANILSCLDRTKAGVTAPPQGLTLMKIEY